jgi:hypothetical protein
MTFGMDSAGNIFATTRNKDDLSILSDAGMLDDIDILIYQDRFNEYDATIRKNVMMDYIFIRAMSDSAKMFFRLQPQDLQIID